MVRAVAWLVSVLLGWATVYTSGLFPWLGTAWQKRSSFGAGNITIVGENRQGTDIGFNTFLFFEGQEVFVEYDAKIRRGSVALHVFQMWDARLGEGSYHHVSETSQGTWTARIPRTGLWHISIEPSVVRGIGPGYDVTYSVTWGARF